MTQADTPTRLELQRGTATILYGAPDCGSSRFLRSLAGIGGSEPAELRVDGAAVRTAALVLGDALLFPHMTLRDNFSLGPQQQGLRRQDVVERVLLAARSMGVDSMLARKPAELSAIERLRAGVARALCVAPEVLLLDDVLQSVPVCDRAQGRAYLHKLHRDLGLSVLIATHDRRDALALGTHLAWMQGGRIVQSGATRALYESPATKDIAAALGDPPMNILRATFAANGEYLTLSGAVDLRLHATWHELAGGTVWFGVRPEHLRVGPADESALALKLERVEQQGAAHCLHGQIEGQPVLVIGAGFSDQCVGDKVWLHFAPHHVHWFDIKSGSRIAPTPSSAG
jgi:sn-glycerol 3-phosphate transport system ATP-binding protein